MKQMVEQLAQMRNFCQHKSAKISKREYKKWLAQYCFDALKNISFGESFCKRFNISDNVLRYIQDRSLCENHIQLTYLK